MKIGLCLKLLLVVLLGGCAGVYAAQLTVVVQNEAGNPVANAKVCYVMQDASKREVLDTGNQGKARFDDVPAGNLLIVTNKDGFLGNNTNATMPSTNFTQTVHLVHGTGPIICPGIIVTETLHDLTVSITQDNPNPIATGGEARYTVTLRNVGNQPESNVKVSVGLPTNTFVGSSCTSGGAGRAICTATQLAAGGQQVFRISATMPTIFKQDILRTGARLSITAQADPNNEITEKHEDNNTASVITQVVLAPDLILEATNTAESTGTTTLTIASTLFVKNNGDGAAANFVVQARLPREVDFHNVEENTLGGACVQGPNIGQDEIVNCTVSSLLAGETKHVRFVTTPISNLANGIRITFLYLADSGNSESEHNENNNGTSASVTFQSFCDLEVTSIRARKGFVADLGGIGNAFQETFLDITVRNNGPDLCEKDSARVTIVWPTAARRNVCSGNLTFDPNQGLCFATDPPFDACFNSCTGTGLSSLQSGESAIVTTGTAFLGLGTSSFTAIATIDSDHEIVEDDEENNTRTFNVHF